MIWPLRSRRGSVLLMVTISVLGDWPHETIKNVKTHAKTRGTPASRNLGHNSFLNCIPYRLGPEWRVSRVSTLLSRSSKFNVLAIHWRLLFNLSVLNQQTLN